MMQKIATLGPDNPARNIEPWRYVDFVPFLTGDVRTLCLYRKYLHIFTSLTVLAIIDDHSFKP